MMSPAPSSLRQATSSLRGRTGRFVMDERDFEGTVVLEQLAGVGLVEEFFDAVDSDDVGRATSLMKMARLDARTMAIVVRKMEEGGAEH
jgi:hypothetical protein